MRLSYIGPMYLGENIYHSVVASSDVGSSGTTDNTEKAATGDKNKCISNCDTKPHQYNRRNALQKL